MSGTNQLPIAPLPPLPLMQTIEAVTRLSSFKRAADELCLTPSAISHRVRQVEERFGQHLFERSGNGILPSEAALKLSEAVAEAVHGIDMVWQGLVAEPETRKIRLGCMSAFAEHFIFENLQDFQRKFPDFHVTSSSFIVNERWATSTFDILVGLGPHPDSGWQCEDIYRLQMRPIYVEREVNPIIAGSCIHGPLIAYETNFIPWPKAAAELGLEIAENARTITYDSMLLACTAARQGQGVALAPDWMAEQLAGQNGLVTISGNAVDSGLNYWLAVRKGRALDSSFGRFRRWIKARVA